MAITERYVTSAATGGYTGSDNINTPTTLTVAFTLGTAGDRFNIKNDGTYSRGASDTLPVAISGNNTSPRMYRGYTTTIGDAERGRTANGDLDTVNMPTIDYASNGILQLANVTHTVLSGLNVTSAYPFNSTIGGGAFTNIYNCKISNTSAAVGGNGVRAGSTPLYMSECDISSVHSASYAVENGAQLFMSACKITGGSGVGVYMNGGGNIANCLIYSSGTGGIRLMDQYSHYSLYNNTIVGCTGHGIFIGPSVLQGVGIFNCHITDNTEWGIYSGSTGSRLFVNNRFRDNGSGSITGPFNPDWISGTEFHSLTTDAGTGASDYASDYSLLSTAVGVTGGYGFKLPIGAWGPPYASAGGGSTAIGGLKSYGSA